VPTFDDLDELEGEEAAAAAAAERGEVEVSAAGLLPF
jgi:hypothetical protein